MLSRAQLSIANLTQRLVLPAIEAEYQNIYAMPITVSAMDLREICAEKVRAINERARYRDFCDLAIVLRNHSLDPKEVIEILKQKELRRPLSKDYIIENLSIASKARESGSENLYYKEEIGAKEMMDILNELLHYL